MLPPQPLDPAPLLRDFTLADLPHAGQRARQQPAQLVDLLARKLDATPVSGDAILDGVAGQVTAASSGAGEAADADSPLRPPAAPEC